MAIYAKLRNKIPINVPELIYNPADPKTLDVLAGFLCLTTFFEANQLQTLFEKLSIHEKLGLCLDLYTGYEKKLSEHWDNLEKQTQVPMNVRHSKADMEQIYKFLKKQSQNATKNAAFQKLQQKSESKAFPEEIQLIINQELQ